MAAGQMKNPTGTTALCRREALRLRRGGATPMDGRQAAWSQDHLHEPRYLKAGKLLVVAWMMYSKKRVTLKTRIMFQLDTVPFRDACQPPYCFVFFERLALGAHLVPRF